MLVFFFTDIEGSTRLWEEHTGVMGAAIARHDEILRQQVEAAGGRITKHTGDGITAAFEGGEPIACALETQKGFATHAWGEIGELRIRIGLHAGEAEYHASAGTPEGDYFGPPVNATARVMAAAWGGQILVTPEVTRVSPLPEQATLLDLGEHLLKNVSAPQQLYQLVHPQLPHQAFPPPRTLSGQSIRQAVDERGGQMAGLEPQAMGVGLVIATLLPALQGELDPETGALEGNLGVLDDLGAATLRQFTASFAEGLRARRQAGESLSPTEIQALLHGELLARWQAGGEMAVALRADASRLLQAVHGVEAAMASATDEVKEALARGLADLGMQFGEFRWMLAGVQDTLAEVRARQALQLALQREQLDLQRQQLVKTNLILRRQQEEMPLAAPAAMLMENGEEDLPRADVPCPYKGLAAFEAEDAEHFFGREELVAELTARLAGTRFLAVVGPSGSGKSSLVRAGLMPATWAGALPGSENWQTLVLTPGSHPLEELATRLSLLQEISPGFLFEDLKAHKTALHLAVKQALAEQPDDVQLLLVVDQFEEVFALCRDEEERRRFIEALVYAVEAEEGRTVVVPIIRADFYGRCADYPRLAALMSDGLLVGPMSEEELQQAIERPAAQVGLRVEPGLAGTIMGDVAHEPGALPLLSHALLETWERRQGRTLTLSGYAAAGGVSGAIAQTADTVFAGFSPQEQAIARSIFLRLTELAEEGTQDTRRRATPSELVRSAEEAPAVEAVLKTLADARLVTTGEGQVEVAHEALIREWPALRGWLEEDREGLRIHRHLTDAAQEWERLGRESGELYRGARLAAAGEWAEAHGEALNPLEREFLSASQELAERQEAEREAQRQRELEAARELAAEQEKRAEDQSRAAKRLRRRALLLAGVMAVAIILAVAAALAFGQASQNAQAAQAEAISRATAQAEADAAASEASQQRDAAQASEREALEAYSLSLVANARKVLEDEDTELALLLALAANAIEDPPAAAQRALLDIAYAPATRRQFVTDQWNEGLDVSPDGQTMLSGAGDGSVFLWDVASGELLKRLEGHTWPVDDVALSPDGRRALSGSGDGTAILWDLDSGEIIHRLVGHSNTVRAVAFGPDGRTALTGGDNGDAPGELILWDLETDDDERRIIRRFGTGEGEHRQGVRAVAISPDGRTALVGLGADPPHDRPLVLWDLETFEVIRFLKGPTTSVNDVAISPDGRFGLSGAASERLVSLWDLETGEELLSLEGHEGVVIGVAFSPDSRTALSTDADGVVIWWDLDTGEAIRRLQGHTEAVWDVDFVDNTSAISASDDGTLRLWDLASSWQLDRWGDGELRHGAAVTALAISPDGRLALSGAGRESEPVAADTSLILWDYQTGQPLRRLEGHSGTVSDVVFSPDGRQALSSSFDGTLILWDLDTGELIRQLEGHTAMVTGVDISSDGSYALSSAGDGTVIHWHLPSGKAVRRFIGHQNTDVEGVAFVPGDQQAVSYGFGSLIVWDVGSGRQVRRLTGLTGRAGGHWSEFDIRGMDLSPDGRTALSAGGLDRTLILWDLASGQSIRRFEGHSLTVSEVMISPDGRTALSGGSDGNLILWDMATGTPLRRLPVSAQFEGPDAYYYRSRVAIHPDGQTAISGEPDGTILKWQLAEPSPAELIAWIGENRPLRELTCKERETYQIVPLCDAEGNPAATTTDLLAAAARVAASLPGEPSPPPGTPAPTAAPLASPPPRPTRMAAVGENRGELARHDFDVWTYDGQAGEVLSLQAQADKPITEFIPVEERFAAGVLDPVLLVIAPDGNLLALADDAPSQQTWLSGDSLIEAVYLPVDGEYRIEVQSILDDTAGGYTLTIESREVDIDPAILQGYVGSYETVRGIHTVSLEDGRLYFHTWPSKMVLDPISETEFIMNPRSFRLTFERDDDGLVTGFDWITWDRRVEGVRLEE